MTQRLPYEDLDFIVRRTLDLWEEMRGQSVFLTGGTGFFGVWLLESLQAANRASGLGVQATILTRNPEAFRLVRPHLAMDPAITLLRGDVRHFSFPEGRFKYVIHAATDTWAREGSGGAVGLLGTILGGTERVLQFAAAHGTEKLLFTSSGAVYGQQPAQMTHIDEDYQGAPDPLRPASSYGEGKRAAEALCVAYGARYGFACKIARCFAFVGPLLPLNQHFAIGNFIRDALRGEAICIQGDGTARRSYMYAADLARWLWTLLMLAPGGEAYNVGSAQSASILELANLVRDVLGSRAEIRVAQAAVPGALAHQYVPSIQKAEQQFGLRCDVLLDEAVRKTARFYRWK
jgi:dTDP-glucose 4,6-dehydratase